MSPKRSRKLKPLKVSARVGCAYCFQKLPQPANIDAYTPGGTLGGRCSCGALFVVDPTGKLGGDALLDLTTMACDGDIGRALELRSGVDYELTTKSLSARDPYGGGNRRPVPGTPQVWFLKLLEH